MTVMSTVNDHYSRRFSDMMDYKSQQRKSRIRPYVNERTLTSAEDWAYDGLGPVEAREKTTRNMKSDPDDIEHWRRKIAKREFVITLHLDQSDIENRLFNPQSEYAEQALAEMEKTYDEVCVQAMHATVFTGKEFGTSVSFAADGGRTVDATAGLTVAKMLEVNKNFLDDEVGNDAGMLKKCMGISGDEYEDLLDLAELTSGDYNRQYPLENGKIASAFGIDLIPFGANVNDPVLPVSGGVRSSFVLSQRGLAVAIGRQWTVTVKDRPDLVNVTQVQVTGVVGATRTEGKRVQKFNTTD